MQPLGGRASRCARITGGGSESGGKAAQAQRGGQPLVQGCTRLARDLLALEWAALCPHCVAATGGHGSDPEPTAHTCTQPGDSAAVISRHNKKKENRQ